MKTSKLVAVIFLLSVSIFPMFGSAETLFINTPLQEIEFHQNLPLPKAWRVCYPNCNEENKIDLNLINKEGSFFSIGQLQSFEEEFFVEDGTVEFFNDSLIVLSASAINVKDLSKEFVDNLNKNTQDKLKDKNITVHDRYVLNHKINVLKEIRV